MAARRPIESLKWTWTELFYSKIFDVLSHKCRYLFLSLIWMIPQVCGLVLWMWGLCDQMCWWIRALFRSWKILFVYLLCCIVTLLSVRSIEIILWLVLFMKELKYLKCVVNARLAVHANGLSIFYFMITCYFVMERLCTNVIFLYLWLNEIFLGF